MLVKLQRAPGMQPVQQRGRDIRQQRRCIFERGGRVDIECQSQAARCRRHRAAGQNEREQFQQIQRRAAGAQAEPAERRRRMHQHRRPETAERRACLLGRQRQQLAILGENDRTAETADKGGNGCQVSAFSCRNHMPATQSPLPGIRYLTTDP